MTYRLILLCLLPVIVVIIYLDGQHYNPDLIRFETDNSKSISVKTILPGQIGDYRISGHERIYTKDNLYEYVNGHAEYFISAGFINLVVGEYSSDKATTGNPDIIIDIYDMGKSIQSFGILSDESGGNPGKIINGLSGFRSSTGVSFAKGKYYIKISAYRNDIPVMEIAEKVSQTIKSAGDSISEFEYLPDIGRIVSTRFVREAYRGLDFINNVLEREYLVAGKSVYVSVFTDATGRPERMLNSFFDYFHDSGISYDKHESKDGSYYIIRDPYEGDWVLIPQDGLLRGVYGFFNDSIIGRIMSARG